MSYILDALKKSERERAVAANRRLPDEAASPVHSALPRQVWPLALGSGLVAGAVVAVIMIWRGAAHESNEPVRAIVFPPPAEATVAAPLPLSAVAELPPVRGLAPAPTASPPAQHAVSPPVAVPPLSGDASFLRQKSAEFQRQLPELAVTVHVYSPDESQRILFINNREYRRGDQIQDGLRVEEIAPDGALLSYRGERFKLRRPY